MAAALPAEIRSAIAAMLEGVSRSDLAARAERLSRRYRDGGGSAATITERGDVLAYLVTRLPATYAAVRAALAAAEIAAPAFAPRSLLDVGAGPGTASFAALDLWPAIASVTMIDSNRPFVVTAGDLALRSGHPALANAERILADLTRFGRDLPSADLVVAGYAMAEIRTDDAAGFVAALWQATAGALAIVEPGTPDGFARIRAARAALIAAGAAIAAPCPHALPCPIVAPDWCHFAERLARSRDHRLAKAADAPFEDEKYSYVVATRPSVAIAPYAARVLAPPRRSKAGIALKLCTDDGSIAEQVVARRDRAAFAAGRRMWWGDALAADIAQSGSQGSGDPS